MASKPLAAAEPGPLLQLAVGAMFLPRPRTFHHAPQGKLGRRPGTIERRPGGQAADPLVQPQHQHEGTEPPSQCDLGQQNGSPTAARQKAVRPAGLRGQGRRQLAPLLLDGRPQVFDGGQGLIQAAAAALQGLGGAENLLDFQRRAIQKFTGAILTDQYGCSEGCGNASHCPEFVYHEDFEFGIMEGVELQKGNPARSILCTGFANEAFPFVRYEVGDTGVWQQEDRPCPCGRQSRAILRIEGRKDDYVVTPEGAHIMRFDYVFKDALNVEEVQIVQERLGEITVRAVRRPTYSTADEMAIAREIQRWISPTIGVRFEYVREIEREANGKFRAVRSKLNSSLIGSGSRSS